MVERDDLADLVAGEVQVSQLGEAAEVADDLQLVATFI